MRGMSQNCGTRDVLQLVQRHDIADVRRPERASYVIPTSHFARTRNANYRRSVDGATLLEQTSFVAAWFLST